MGRKKRVRSSSKHLCSAEFVPTRVGHICKKIEIICVRCQNTEIIEVPEELIYSVTDEILADTAFAEYIAQQAGWVWREVVLRNGKQAVYMLCPDCIEEDFKNFNPSSH